MFLGLGLFLAAFIGFKRAVEWCFFLVSWCVVPFFGLTKAAQGDELAVSLRCLRQGDPGEALLFDKVKPQDVMQGHVSWQRHFFNMEKRERKGLVFEFMDRLVSFVSILSDPLRM